MIELLWSRESWCVTLAVLAIVFGCELNLKNTTRWRSLLKLAIPLVASAVLHVIRFETTDGVDTAKLISDLLYDFFAPLGIYHVVSTVRSAQRESKDKR